MESDFQSKTRAQQTVHMFWSHFYHDIYTLPKTCIFITVAHFNSKCKRDLKYYDFYALMQQDLVIKILKCTFIFSYYSRQIEFKTVNITDGRRKNLTENILNAKNNNIQQSIFKLNLIIIKWWCALMRTIICYNAIWPYVRVNLKIMKTFVSCSH